MLDREPRECASPAWYRPVSFAPALTTGLMTKSPWAGRRVWIAREERLRAGSSHSVGMTGMPAPSSSRR